MGVICKKTYVSVRDLSPDGSNIQTACFAYNSQLATYFSAITSSRMGHYITELLADELLDVPLPLNPISNLADFDSFAQIDAEARRVFTLTQADWTLVEDFLSITLPDALRKRPGAGHHITARTPSKREFQTEVVNYARFFSRVVKSTFGKANNVCATVFEEPPHSPRLPVRMTAIHMDWPGHEQLKVEQMEGSGLMDVLGKLHSESMERRTRACSGTGLAFSGLPFFSTSTRKNTVGCSAYTL